MAKFEAQARKLSSEREARMALERRMEALEKCFHDASSAARDTYARTQFDNIQQMWREVDMEEDGATAREEQQRAPTPPRAAPSPAVAASASCADTADGPEPASGSGVPSTSPSSPRFAEGGSEGLDVGSDSPRFAEDGNDAAGVDADAEQLREGRDFTRELQTGEHAAHSAVEAQNWVRRALARPHPPREWWCSAPGELDD